MTDSHAEGTTAPVVPTEQPERLDLRSHDILAEKQQELLRLFPEICTEGGKIDFDRLRRVLGQTVDPGKERYGMNWPGKADCFKSIQSPSVGTLLPRPEESIEFDSTENQIIEGDNLEVLKLLQKAYLAKIKMIYIDPPYNIGNDFIYPDNYSESLQTYLEYTGQVDSEGRKFSTNTEADGRFHSKWLNMMYPRLYLARNLLREDGVIFISIDEHEMDSLRKICNEVFGEENHIADLVWAQNVTHSQAPLYSMNHEYVIVYARNAESLESFEKHFREPKPGCKEVQELVQRLNPSYPSIATIEQELKALADAHKAEYEQQLHELGLTLNDETEKQDPWRGIYAYNTAEYRDVSGAIVDDSQAAQRSAQIYVWQSDNSSAPAGKQSASTLDPDSPNFRFYRPKHPKTGKPCPHPKTGWRWPRTWPDSNRESFEKLAAAGRIIWGADETNVPRYKRFLSDVETNVAKSIFFDYTDGEKQVAELLGRPSLFPNPKPSSLISRLISHVCTSDSLVLDFFAGSGTTAQAVLEHNSATGSACRFILVQLPEIIDPTNKDQEAAAKFCDEIGRPRTIAEITKERVRRVSKKFSVSEAKEKADLFGKQSPQPDVGFRVFALAESNFKPWSSASLAAGTAELTKQLELHVSHVRSGRSTQDILAELLIKSGFALSTHIETVTLAGKEVFSVSGGEMLICLEKELTTDSIRAIAEQKPWRVICLDEGFSGNDQLKTNAVQIMKAKGVTSFKTV